MSISKRQEDIQMDCDLSMGHLREFHNPYVFHVNKFVIDSTNEPYIPMYVPRLFIYSASLMDSCDHIREGTHIDIIFIGNGDENIGLNHLIALKRTGCTWQKIFAQNLCITEEQAWVYKAFILPIGPQNRVFDDTDYTLTLFDPNEKREGVLLAIDPYTHPSRLQCIDQLRSIGIHNNILIKSEYIEQMKKCKYCICPRGNGYDTHRFWEALMYGCTPIVLKNDFTTLLQKQWHVKLIEIDNWSEVKDIVNYKVESTEYE